MNFVKKSEASIVLKSFKNILKMSIFIVFGFKLFDIAISCLIISNKTLISVTFLVDKF